MTKVFFWRVYYLFFLPRWREKESGVNVVRQKTSRDKRKKLNEIHRHGGALFVFLSIESSPLWSAVICQLAPSSVFGLITLSCFYEKKNIYILYIKLRAGQTFVFIYKYIYKNKRLASAHGSSSCSTSCSWVKM